MKKVLLTLVIGIITISGFGQFKKDGMRYFDLTGEEKRFLKFYNISYCDPQTRMEAINDTDDIEILESYNQHLIFNTGDEFTVIPDTNRIIMSGFDFHARTDWYDSYSEEINYELAQWGKLIIGMKEYPLGDNLKKFVFNDCCDSFRHTFKREEFISVVIVEGFFRRHSQVTSSLYLRHKSGKLVDIGNENFFSNLQEIEYK